MERNRFIISDTHFQHRNILNFKKNDGSPLRDFESIEAHDEALVANWNRVVRPNDSVYHLGDVVINRKALPILYRLNGKLRLVRGNHDVFKTKDYMQYFEEIYGVRVFDSRLGNLIFTHIPVHDSQFCRFAANIHGHTHANVVTGRNAERYIPMSVEHTNFTPVAWEDLLNIVEKSLNAPVADGNR